ncbi:MAG: nitrate reductase [Verrucomicrobiaceae bacterium]|nr:nitrate reductase [Verrucomicrobiaceae bacterium]
MRDGSASSEDGDASRAGSEKRQQGAAGQGGFATLLRSSDGPLTQQLGHTSTPLGNLPASLVPTATTSMVCGFCATGCSLKIHLRDGEAINLSANEDYPVNLGMACPKGWEALTPLDAPDRGTTPLWNGKPVCWSTASQTFVQRMKAIIAEHGPESVAVLSTGQIVTEEMAFLGAFAKFGMGIRHIDSNTRQCMATAATAYKQSFGFDAPPFTYADFEESDVLVFIGANPCIAHPIMWQRVMMNQRSPKIVVVDPRRTETAMAATHHYAIKPKSDLTFLYGLANLVIERGAVDDEFIAKSTSGYEAFAEFVKAFDVERVSRESGISVAQLREFADLIASKKRVSFWWTMGVNQGHESTRTAQAIINLALMTGNIGKPGTGANSITGQCNAMGSRLFANATSLIGGHDPAKPEHRAKVAGILGIEESLIHPELGLAYDQIMERVADGRIKALWVLATNTSHSWIDSEAANRALEKLEFLCVQDMYPTTDTAKRAHLYLPAAGWGEKEGSFINAERRIGLVKKVKRAPGQSLSDFNILRLLASAWGCGETFAKWSSPEAVFELMKQLSQGQPCDITGIEGYEMIEREGGVQWPRVAQLRRNWTAMPDEERSEETFASCGATGLLSERRLFEDGVFFHEDGRAKFLFDAPREMPEMPSEEFPLVLLSGRGTSAQWHTNTRTGKSEVLKRLHPAQCYVEIHPDDAQALGIAAQQRVQVASRRSAIEATAVLTSTVQRGNVFMPMHYDEVNKLTFAAFDPHSRQPSYKACAVRVSIVGN